MKREGKGGLFLSLPAGINEDVSDPMGAGTEAWYTCHLCGTAYPPCFGGVAHVPAFLPRPQREGRFRTANHSGMSHIDEYGCGTPKP